MEYTSQLQRVNTWCDDAEVGGSPVARRRPPSCLNAHAPVRARPPTHTRTAMRVTTNAVQGFGVETFFLSGLGWLGGTLATWAPPEDGKLNKYTVIWGGFGLMVYALRFTSFSGRARRIQR